jgi:hypothetical protein
MEIWRQSLAIQNATVKENFMSTQPDVSNVSRRQFLSVAGSVAAASSLAMGKHSESPQTPSALVQPVHYLVTIDVTSGSISYSAQNKDTSQAVSMPNNCLTVNKGDEVKWQAKTASPHPQYRASIRFTTTSPFSVPEFKWSENQFGGGNTLTAGTYYYCVGVFDKVKHEIYADDPKIIVGGTFDARAKVEEAERELGEVKEKIGSIESILLKAIDELNK